VTARVCKVFVAGLLCMMGSAVPTVTPAGAQPSSNGGPGGYWMLGADGGVYTFGDARYFGSPSQNHTFTCDVNNPDGCDYPVSMAPTGDGYEIITTQGHLYPYGNAPTFGHFPAPNALPGPIVFLDSTGSGQGLWAIDSTGCVYTVGDAHFFGDMCGRHLNAPIVYAWITPDEQGYWLLGGDGGVFTFGDAGFFGSTGGLKLNAPVAAITATPDGRGYWLVARDGGVFAFGDAGFFGSAASTNLQAPMARVLASSDGQGYLLIGEDGGVFTFGDAPFFGSLASSPPSPLKNRAIQDVAFSA
jgi:hypothetical protein